MERYLYSEIANAVLARLNCLDGKHWTTEHHIEWAQKHEDTIETLVKEFLPSGSGYDSGTKIDFDRSHGNKLVFTTSFHHMDEQGGYDGWTEHVVVLTPSLIGNFDLRISGRNRNDIKDMMYEDFDYSLRQVIDFSGNWT